MTNHLRKKNKKQKSNGNPIVWSLCGIMAGALIASSIFLKFDNKFENKNTPLEIAFDKEKASSETKQENKTPVFDFYTILPKMDAKFTEKSKNPAKITEPIKIPLEQIKYIVEVKTSENISEVDELKAELTLIGLYANITKFQKNNTILYKLALGPFNLRQEAHNTQKILIKNNISDSVIKNVN